MGAGASAAMKTLLEADSADGAQWTDSEWPATDAALGDLVAAKFAGAGGEPPPSQGDPVDDDGAASTGSSVAWQWPEEFVDVSQSGAPVLFEGDPAANDVLEGRLGDCFLLAAMSVIAASHPELIRRLFIREALQPGAPVGVRLFVDGEWRIVLVDQRVPVGPTGRPLFGRARQPNLMWVPLLEKAYAKVCELCNARCAMRDARCAMRDARCAMRDARLPVRADVHEHADVLAWMSLHVFTRPVHTHARALHSSTAPTRPSRAAM
mmetsp:Transcript_69856/g.195315  ORF Transcript_69856/g.195315 Transcript_69856/m.195315 type:complete len:265 (-) Transcript_69856:1122-1916(-)